MGRPRGEDKQPSDLSLEELIPRWNRAVWFSGIRPLLRRMLEADRSLAEMILLHALQHHPLTIAEVGDMLCLSHSAASRAADRLVRDGLVSRQENPSDRRQKQLTLTPQGEALIAEVEALRSRRLQQAVATLSGEEHEHLRSLLARLVAAAEASDEFAEDPEGCPARGRRREFEAELAVSPRAGQATLTR